MDDMDRSDEIPTGIQQVGEFALSFIEHVEASFGENAVIGTVGIVAEVSYMSGNIETSNIVAWSTEDRTWVQAALFDKAADATRDESC